MWEFRNSPLTESGGKRWKAEEKAQAEGKSTSRFTHHALRITTQPLQPLSEQRTATAKHAKYAKKIEKDFEVLIRAVRGFCGHG